MTTSLSALRVVNATADDADIGVAHGETILDGTQERGDVVFQVAVRD